MDMSECIQKNNVGDLNAISTNNKPLNFIRRLLLVLFISKIAQMSPTLHTIY